jgi:hypothetical protein
MSSESPAEKALLEGLYASFAKRDYRGMAACYHPSTAFQDPVFNLKGKRVSAMWHMLCEGAKDFELEASGIRVDGDRGEARWKATYTFSGTGRKVVNRVKSEFRFKDGTIWAQRDAFSFWNWSRQALGPVGLFFGWAHRLQQIAQRKAAKNLDAFLKSHPEYAEP